MWVCVGAVWQVRGVVQSVNVTKAGGPTSPDSVLDEAAGCFKRQRSTQEEAALQQLRTRVEADCSQVRRLFSFIVVRMRPEGP